MGVMGSTRDCGLGRVRQRTRHGNQGMTRRSVCSCREEVYMYIVMLVVFSRTGLHRYRESVFFPVDLPRRHQIFVRRQEDGPGKGRLRPVSRQGARKVPDLAPAKAHLFSATPEAQAGSGARTPNFWTGVRERTATPRLRQSTTSTPTLPANPT